MRMRNERGFALPTTILLVTVLTVMLAAAFTRTSSDLQVADGSQAIEEALSVAQSGLQRYFEDISARPADGDSTRYNVTGGYAWVKSFVLRSPADTMENQMFLITSTGYVIEPNQGSAPVAERTVAQVAFWQTARVLRPAAWVAANGIDIGDDKAKLKIDGVKEPGPDTLGLRSPGPPTGDTVGFNPIGFPTGALYGGTAESVALSTGIDWQSIRNGEFDYDATVLFSGNSDWTWSTYFIDGDLTLTSKKKPGTGVLIVTGDLILSHKDFEWRGLVLVGGRIIVTVSGKTKHKFKGMLLTGLNEQIPALPSVLANYVSDHKKNKFEVFYESSFVSVAISNFTGMVPLENTWYDNWATY